MTATSLLSRTLTSCLVWGLASQLASCSAEAPPVSPPLLRTEQPIETSTIDDINDALELFERSTVEKFTHATDPLERGETFVSEFYLTQLVERDDFGGTFNLGDEAFESERDRIFGMGIGEQPPLPRPTPVQRLQDGEIGGVDSTSCRSCHFAGGPDGGGTLTQVGLFRSNGQDLSTATHREAPHVMGLGYISIMARQIERGLQQWLQSEIAFAQNIGEPVVANIFYEDIDFGQFTVYPDGSYEIEEPARISADLTIRPFGLKGRHPDLVHLIDEALQLHHGLQSTARLEMYAEQPETFLGEGENPFDRDNDGREGEITPGQSALLASYLSMLGVPRMRPPENPELALIWARGQRLFQEVGCATCHRPTLRFDTTVTDIGVLGREEMDFQIDLAEFGQDPRPVSIDFGPIDDGPIPAGTPIFAFTDLRRHDMGPELAEPNPEILPDGAGEVPGSVWLTRPLWGLADTAPYLHDGRAPTVHDAIEWHGGEGAESRDSYLALEEGDQGAVRVFLMSLTRDGVLLVE